MISFVKKAIVLVPVVAAAFSSPDSLTVKLEGQRFIPAEVRAHPGDTLRFVNGNGGPHNVEFPTDSVPKDARKPFEKVMSGGRSKLGPTSSPLLIDPAETYVMVVPDVPAGRYAFVCVPHAAGNMRGGLTVVRE